VNIYIEKSLNFLTPIINFHDYIIERLSKSIKYWLLAITVIFVSLLFSFYLKLGTTNEIYLYVSIKGDNRNGGTIDKPFQSIQQAIDIALKSPNTSYTIKIFPGIYREAINIKDTSNRQIKIKIQALDKISGKAILSGSEPTLNYSWNLCDKQKCNNFPEMAINHIYYTTLDWEETPYFIVKQSQNGITQQLYTARDPDFQITTPWKYHEHWWTVENQIPSKYSILDYDHLSKLNNLTGTNILIIDGADRCGTFLYQKTIDKFNKNQGEITFNKPVGFSIFGSQETGIGPNTKYFVEGNKQFLNSPGEWVYDSGEKKLYLWPPDDIHPAKLPLEIAKRYSGMKIVSANNLEIDGVEIRNINYSTDNINGAVIINPSKNETVENIIFKNSSINNSGNGIIISADSERSNINKIDVSDLKIHSLLKNAIFSLNARNIRIENSEIYNSGQYFNENGINIIRTNNVRLLNNKIHDTGYNGVQIVGYEKSDKEIKNVLIENNTIYNSCQSSSFCAALKLYGGKYNNTIVRKNVLKDNIGWSYCQEKTSGKNQAHGLFISNASGITVDSNTSLNNTLAGFHVYPRQIEANNNIFTNNLAGNSRFGIDLANGDSAHDADKNVIATRHDNTVIKNNIFWNNGIGSNLDVADPEKVFNDYNAYIDNGTNILNHGNESEEWNKNSIVTAKKAFKNAGKYDFNLPLLSPLKGRGEPQLKNPFLQFQLEFFGLGNDIGPCKFRWIGNSCSVLN